MADPWAWRSNMDAPQPSPYGQARLTQGPAPTGHDRIRDALMQTFGLHPGSQTLQSAARAADLGTLGMVSGAYDGGRELAQTGRPSALAMALMPGAKVAAPAAKAAGKAASEAVQGIRAYHGSPYDFDKFDLSKIGTGEGAQAYGHGLYFAEKEEVARSYRDTLSMKNDLTIYGRPINVSDPIENNAADRLASSLGDKEFAISRYVADIIGAKWDPERQKQLQAEAAVLRDMVKSNKTSGRMYEVNIKANPDDFLDWDKPLSEQPEKIRQALQSKKADGRASQGIVDQDSNGDWIAYSTNGGQYTAKTEAEAYAMLKDPPVGQAYDLRDPKKVAELRSKGVAGVRYLDEGSRGAGDGTRNYVAFDDSLIEIIRKYGLIPPAVAGGVAASQSDPAQASP